MELEDRIINLFHNSMDTNAHTIEQYTPLIAHASELMLATLASELKILCIGNGGSAALAQHFSALLLSRFRNERPGLPALALGADSAALTGVAEESSFSDVYSKQVRALGQPGDILLVVSSQGKSNSLVQAVQAAHDREMSVIAITGGDASNISALLRPDEVEISVPSEDNAMIYGAHVLILHCLCDLIEFQLFGA
ncbi:MULTISPECIES: SIS domain-containing protein [Neptunomonas]|uniref:SIS domain-containing protein n=1 Tax=Neptunomonas marina TaxID=1815562 RepID=A0A437Q7K7_9GAMM|nr:MULTISPECIES: SIS domain-containing protein [Neptunomonas]RVU30469.1 SIS domain-containing protein [Neptunomonas marina]